MGDGSGFEEDSPIGAQGDYNTWHMGAEGVGGRRGRGLAWVIAGSISHLAWTRPSGDVVGCDTRGHKFSPLVVEVGVVGVGLVGAGWARLEVVGAVVAARCKPVQGVELWGPQLVLPEALPSAYLWIVLFFLFINLLFSIIMTFTNPVFYHSIVWPTYARGDKVAFNHRDTNETTHSKLRVTSNLA